MCIIKKISSPHISICGINSTAPNKANSSIRLILVVAIVKSSCGLLEIIDLPILLQLIIKVLIGLFLLINWLAIRYEGFRISSLLFNWNDDERTKRFNKKMIIEITIDN